MSIPNDAVLNIVNHCLAHPNFKMRYSYGQQSGSATDTDLLQDLLIRKPEVFLERYGTLLSGPLLEALNRWYPNHYEVQHYLKVSRRQQTAQAAPQTQTDPLIRNRRYQRMLQLRAGGEYFGLHEMQRRRPLLYYQYVGRYKGTFHCDRPDGLADRLLYDMEAEDIQKRLEQEQSEHNLQQEAEEYLDRQHHPKTGRSQRSTGVLPTCGAIHGGIPANLSPVTASADTSVEVSSNPDCGHQHLQPSHNGRSLEGEAKLPPGDAAWPQQSLLAPNAQPKSRQVNIRFRPTTARTVCSSNAIASRNANVVSRGTIKFGVVLPSPMHNSEESAPTSVTPVIRKVSSTRPAVNSQHMNAAFRKLRMRPSECNDCSGDGGADASAVASSQQEIEGNDGALWGETSPGQVRRASNAPEMDQTMEEDHLSSGSSDAEEDEEEEEEEEDDSDADSCDQNEEMEEQVSRCRKAVGKSSKMPEGKAAQLDRGTNTAHSEAQEDSLSTEQQRFMQVGSRHMRYEAPAEVLSEEEMQLLLQQFTSIMESCFLDGEDSTWVDYCAIDNDTSLDNVAQQNADAEDEYFDSEEPSDAPAAFYLASVTADSSEEYNEENNWGF